MSETQKFAKLDKLADGLRGLTEPELEKGNNPQHKEWKSALNALPKKDQQEYKQQKFDEAKRDKHLLESAKKTEEELQTLCKHNHPYAEEWLKNKLEEDRIFTEQGARDAYPEIGPQDLSNTETVFFAFAESGKKHNSGGFEWAHQQVKMNKEKGGTAFANLLIPETVPIDYSEYSHIPAFKRNLHAKPYKDGVLLVVNDHFKNNKLIVALTLGRAEGALTGKADFSIGKIIAEIYESRCYNHSQIDWHDKKFDEQVVFYVVVPRIIKNKAARIVFKNNKKLNGLIKIFRKHPPMSKIKVDKFKYFFDQGAQSQHVVDSLQYCQDKPELKIEHNFNNSTLLAAGYQRALKQCWNIEVMYEETHKKEILFFERLENKPNLEDLQKEYMKDIFPYEQHLDISLLTKDPHSEHAPRLLKKNFLKASLLYHHTHNGTTFCNGKPIDTSNKSKVDCLLFWKKIDVFELLFSPLNNNFPLCMEDSKIINEVDIFDPILNKHIDVTQDIFDKESYVYEYKDIKEFNFKEKHILQEALDCQTGYLMPFDGDHELLHDPKFIHVRFREYKDFIIIVLCEKNGRYLVDVFSKAEVDFKYMIWHNLKYDANYSEQCLQEIYSKFAQCIRDAKILENRTSSMQYRGRRKPYGSKTDEVYPTYFPRKRYTRDYSKEQQKREKDFFNESKKFSGSRCAHVRKLPSDCKPSMKQLLLAKRLDRWVPPNHTFVSETKWGQNMTQREKRFRNTCLNGVLYYNNKQLSEAVKIDGLCPAQFEEYCENYVQKLGYTVKTRQNYDGGIDIRAIKILDDHRTEYLLVQCKHWKKPIPPGEMRDFKAGCDEEKTEYEKVLMFMSSSKFSPGAREYAEKFNIKLIDGDDLLK